MIISFFLTFFIGYITLCLFFPKLKSLFLKFSLSFGIGFIFEAFLTFLMNLLNIKTNWNIIYFAIILIYASIISFNIKKKGINIFEYQTTKSNKILLTLFLICVFASFFELFLHFLKEPTGSWDGDFIWNLHSKFFYVLHSQKQNFTDFFDKSISWTHLDYPLLLPMYNLKTHILAGAYSNIAPAITSFCFYICTLFLLVGVVEETTDRNNALLSGIILISMKPFIWESMAQCADVPLAYLILSTFAFAILYHKYKNINFLRAMFFFAATTTFCKNEGCLFFLAFLLAYTIINKFSNIKEIILSSLIPILFTLYFKLFIFGESDIFANNNLSIEAEKVKTILEYYVTNLSNYTNLILISLLAVITKFRTNNYYAKIKLTILALLIMMFIGYIFIYAISPHNLLWHLSTSSVRLMVQFMPVYILFLFLTFNCCNKSNN